MDIQNIVSFVAFALVTMATVNINDRESIVMHSWRTSRRSFIGGLFKV